MLNLSLILYPGAISNLLVMPQSSLVPLKSHQRASNSLRFSLLEKYSQTSPASNGMATLLPSREHEAVEEYCSTDLLNQQISDLEVLSVSLCVSACISCMPMCCTFIRISMLLNTHCHASDLVYISNKIAYDNVYHRFSQKMT